MEIAKKLKKRSKLLEVLKDKNLQRQLFSNVVILVEVEYIDESQQNKVVDVNTMVCKFSRIARFGINWEYLTQQLQKSYVPCLSKFFVPIKFIQKVPIMVDKSGQAIADLPDKIEDIQTKSILWNVSYMKKFNGKTLSNWVGNENATFPELISALKNLMGILQGAQKHLCFTHNDFHGRNVLCKPAKEKYNVYNLFAWDGKHLMLVRTNDMDYGLLDLENSYNIGMEEIGLQGGKMDTFELNKIPFRFDPQSDVITILCNLLSEFCAKNPNNSESEECLEYFEKFTSKFCKRKFKYNQKTPDKITEELYSFLNVSEEFKALKEDICGFIRNYYYILLEYLFFDIKWSSNKPNFFPCDMNDVTPLESTSIPITPPMTPSPTKISKSSPLKPTKKHHQSPTKASPSKEIPILPKTMLSTNYLDDESSTRLSQVGTLNSDELKQWIKPKVDDEKKKKGLIEKIYQHMTNSTEESDIKKLNARKKDMESIQFEPFLDTEKKIGKPFEHITEQYSIIKNRVVLYRLVCKVIAHLLSIIKEKKTNFESIFLILKKLYEKRNDENPKFGDVEIIAHFLDLEKKDWFKWFSQFNVYRELCAKHLFELYRIYNANLYGSYTGYSHRNNFQLFEKYSLEVDSNKRKIPVALDPLVAYHLLDKKFDVSKLWFDNNTVVRIFHSDFNEPKEFLCSTLSKEDLQSLENSTSEEAAKTILRHVNIFY